MAIQKAGRLQFQDLFEVVGVGAFTVNFASAATGSGTFAGSVTSCSSVTASIRSMPLSSVT
jgi:hypothetical protein